MKNLLTVHLGHTFNISIAATFSESKTVKQGAVLEPCQNVLATVIVLSTF